MIITSKTSAQILYIYIEIENSILEKRIILQENI